MRSASSRPSLPSFAASASASSLAMARSSRTSLRRWRRATLVAIPNSHGRASPRSWSKRPRSSKATKKV
jgi:hypothetical protein